MTWAEFFYWNTAPKIVHRERKWKWEYWWQNWFTIPEYQVEGVRNFVTGCREAFAKWSVNFSNCSDQCNDHCGKCCGKINKACIYTVHPLSYMVTFLPVAQYLLNSGKFSVNFFFQSVECNFNFYSHLFGSLIMGYFYL